MDVLGALRSLPKSQGLKIAGDGSHAWICCPYHKKNGRVENTPSMKVHVRKTGKYLPGIAHCFACSKHTTIDKILNPNSEDNSEERDDYPYQLHDEGTIRLLEGADKDFSFLQGSFPWREEEDWRGVRGTLLSRVGARLFFNTDANDLMAYLPCMVGGEHVGGIKAKLFKSTGLKYINTEGSWTSELGLYPYDHTKKILKRSGISTVMLCEGSRDALKSIQHGIPALAILGTGNISDRKVDLILNLGLQRVILGFDPDEAGLRATKKLFEMLSQEIETKIFKFSKYDKNMDPGNMPKEISEKIKKFLI